MKCALAFLLLYLAVPACMAQSAIHHCVSADGTPVFTDQPCGSIASLKLGAIVPGMRHSCTATRGALRRRVAAAFHDRDPNALAGLMLWQDYGDSEALREVAQLQKAMQRPLLGVVDANGPPPSASAPAPPPPSSSVTTPPPDLGTLVVQLGGVQPDPGTTLRFAIEARAGCLWLHP
jgi:hypothetical protein